MYELVQVAQNTYYVECPTKIGIYRVNDNDVWLVDSGNDKDAARKLLKHVEANNWKITAVINTHSNADHMGGNELVVKRTGCAVYATPQEGAVLKHTLIEPTILFGGYPPKILQNKFLMAKPSVYADISTAKLPEGMEIFSLPGHYLGMIGVKTPDNVCFMADALFSSQTIEKYHITYVYDVRAHFDTLDKISSFKANLFIPSHCKPVKDLTELIDINRQNSIDIINNLAAFCHTPLSFDEILQKIFVHYNLNMDMNQYVLVGSCIRSYLAYMMDEGQLLVSFDDSIVRWYSTPV